MDPLVEFGLVYSLGLLGGVGFGLMVAGAVVAHLQLALFEAQVEGEKYRSQRDQWRRVAELPDALEHRQPLTDAELERRHDVVIDEASDHGVI